MSRSICFHHYNLVGTFASTYDARKFSTKKLMNYLVFLLIILCLICKIEEFSYSPSKSVGLHPSSLQSCFSDVCQFFFILFFIMLCHIFSSLQLKFVPERKFVQCTLGENIPKSAPPAKFSPLAASM